jgi:V/A-type H+-transporting ATPase subunit D
VKHAKNKVQEIEEELLNKIERYSISPGIWREFTTNLVSVAEIKTSTKKIAGVKIPVMEEVIFKEAEYSLFSNPKWFAQGISVLKELGTIALEREFFYRKMELLNYARRKTTQKVNLYEKVQIPEYIDALRKIKKVFGR